MPSRIVVVTESPSGRNTQFKDTRTGEVMSRRELTGRIDRGVYPTMHNRVINDVKTPCTNPDKSTRNNLG